MTTTPPTRPPTAAEVAQMARYLREATAALNEVGESYVAIVSRFIEHVDGERRMLAAIADSGDADNARRLLPAVERLSLELRVMLTELTTDEEAPSADV